MNRETAVIIEPPATHDASVIWLHGLGADGHDFESIVPELRLLADHGIRFVFPHAPQRPVTINDGMVMRAWYDITSPELDQHEDSAGIDASAHLLHDWIETETVGGLPAERIVVAGFSQGGAIALHGGLRYPQRLAGILALSCYLPQADRLQAEAAAANRSTPICMLHGDQDPIIPLQLGQASRDFLQQAGYRVQWHDYPMPHSVCLEEIAAISRWLQEVLR